MIPMPRLRVFILLVLGLPLAQGVAQARDKMENLRPIGQNRPVRVVTTTNFITDLAQQVGGGRELGPESLWIMGTLTLLNLVFVLVFYKELQLATFDPGLAAALGFLPGTLHYLLMSLVSITAVGAFQSVGAILIVAFMIIPPATAYLLTQRLPVMIGLAVGVGAASSLLGYLLAILLDASIAGMMATVAGVLFGLALLFSPWQGLVTHRRQREEVAARLLVAHLAHHDRPVPLVEVQREFGWNPRFLRQVQELALRAGWVELQGAGLRIGDRIRAHPGWRGSQRHPPRSR